MPEGSQKFASESIFNFNFIFKLKFEFRLWEHLGKLGLVVFAQTAGFGSKVTPSGLSFTSGLDSFSFAIRNEDEPNKPNAN